MLGRIAETGLYAVRWTDGTIEQYSKAQILGERGYAQAYRRKYGDENEESMGSAELETLEDEDENMMRGQGRKRTCWCSKYFGHGAAQDDSSAGSKRAHDQLAHLHLHLRMGPRCQPRLPSADNPMPRCRPRRHRTHRRRVQRRGSIRSCPSMKYTRRLYHRQTFSLQLYSNSTTPACCWSRPCFLFLVDHQFFLTGFICRTWHNEHRQRHSRSAQGSVQPLRRPKELPRWQATGASLIVCLYLRR